MNIVPHSHQDMALRFPWWANKATYSAASFQKEYENLSKII